MWRLPQEFAANYPESVFESIDKLAQEAARNIKPSIIADHEGQKAVIKGCNENSEKTDC